VLTNRKAPPPSQCHPIHRPLGTHPRLLSPMVWALPTTQGPQAQEVGPGMQQHPSTRLLGQQMHQNKKHWCRKGSHTCDAAFNACLNTCLRRVLPFLGPSKATLSRNLPNSLGVRRAKASNVQRPMQRSGILLVNVCARPKSPHACIPSMSLRNHGNDCQNTHTPCITINARRASQLAL